MRSNIPDAAADGYSDAIEAALADAHALVDIGIPVFAARLDEEGNPDRLDKRWGAWQKKRAGRASHIAIDGWKPGDALCAVTGVKYDVLDYDPRNGGELSLARLSRDLDEDGPEVYGRVATPSGGQHMWIELLGIGKHTGFMPGLDLQGGKEDGSSRGFVFLPPTERPSKKTGELVQYTWIKHLAQTNGHATIDPIRRYIERELARPATNDGATPGRTAVSTLKAEALAAGSGDQRTALLRLVHEWERMHGSGHPAVAELLTDFLPQMPIFDPLKPWYPVKGRQPDYWVRNLQHHAGAVVADATPEEMEGEFELKRISKVELNLPDGFWTEHAVYEHIRNAAYARGDSADAVLGAVLARLSAMAPPGLRADIGKGPTPLSLFSILCGPPESGKNHSIETAMDLLPGIVEYPGMPDGAEASIFADEKKLGTGEGIAEAFMGSVKIDGKSVRTKTRDHAFFFQDEGQKLAKELERGGGNVGETLRSAWSGSGIGAQNGRSETTRDVPRGSYSIGIVIGFQPGTIGPLISRDEISAGTPQRFLYLSAVDPHKPQRRRDAPGWPGPINLQWPARITIPDSIANEAWEAINSPAPDKDLLLAHGDLMRVRIAVMLAILRGSGRVTDEDWQMALVIRCTSLAVLKDMLKHVKKDADASRREQHVFAADKAVAVATAIEKQSSDMVQAVGRAARHLQRDNCAGCKRRCLVNSLSYKLRKRVDADIMLTRLVVDGYAAEPDARGMYSPGPRAAT